MWLHIGTLVSILFYFSSVFFLEGAVSVSGSCVKMAS
jgi:hypothetical protein